MADTGGGSQNVSYSPVCNIGVMTYQVPARPSWCPVSAWGHRITADAREGRQSVSLGCGYLSGIDAGAKAPILQYGQSDVTGAGICTSRESAITCRRNSSSGPGTGYGFRVNRSGVTMIAPGSPLDGEQVPVATVVDSPQPWNGGTPASWVAVTDRTTGTCWSSGAAERSDAVRCGGSTNSLVYDPCFLAADGSARVLCPTHGVKAFTELTVVGSLPATAAPQGVGRLAWSVALPDGSICSIFTGAGAVVDGLREYGCDHGILRAADTQSGPVWSGDYTAEAGSSTPTTMDLPFAEVWI